MEEIATITAPETPVADSPTPETPESPTPETPTPETPAPETPETPAEGADDDELPGDPGEGDSIETDARTMDKQTREAIAKLKKSDPAAAKLLAKQYYGRAAYEKEFPTVQDARQAKATIESLGGEEGISKLQEEVTDYRQEIEQFSNGDPALIEQLYKANPESTAKMVEHALDLFTKSGNVEALDQIILAPMVKRLQQVGLHGHLLKAAEFIKAGKGQEAYDTLGAVGEWLSKLTGDAEKMGTTRTAKDPREEQFAKERQQLDQEKRENYDRSVGAEVNELNNRALNKVIGNFYKEVGLDHEGKREFTQAVLQKIWSAMREDKVFQRQARDIKSKGDKTRTAQFINAKFAEVAPKIFRNYKNQMYPKLAQIAAKPNGQPPPTNGKPAPKAAVTQPSNGQAIRVKDVPGPNEVDWAKDPGDKLWAKGLFYKPNDAKLYSYF